MIKHRMIILAAILISVVSCRQTEESNRVMEEAINVYLSSTLDDEKKVDSSLALTNKAIKLDDHNIAALTHKTTLLFQKRDIKGLLQTVDYLIKLIPDRPGYLTKKALYLELKGDSSIAKMYYDSARVGYKRYLKTDSLDFNLLLEYVGFLDVVGDTTLAGETLEKMEKMDFDEWQLEMLSYYRIGHRKSLKIKQRIKSYWDGEIDYKDLQKDYDQF